MTSSSAGSSRGAFGGPVRARAVGRPDRGEVALVPGLAVARYLRPAAVALADLGWRAWLLRPPGWPGTAGTKQRQPTSMSRLGGAVADWLAEQPQPMVLIGQSIGTQIAAHAAVAAPDRVRALVLQGPTVDPTRRSVGRLLAGWVRDAPHESRWLGPSQLPEWVSVGPRHVVRLLRACLDDDVAATLARLGDDLPVLVVRGRADRMSNASWAASLSTAGLVEMSGAHATAASHPGEFARLVTTLIGALIGADEGTAGTEAAGHR
jgi:pimeloyl-ACP methyl ester carboxylesterase